ncbi:hypothetical protein C448_04474 [Halococcus morrhuae DSM 1307]|uniref:Uncharacterized protein n=1 Tax=Halococcus morrhuae DSM 1307 TaxID=931277 RepID=M0MQP3_HALMO|nr:hypothetical protein [Halococcus morrhuae]EMA47663.1 hypothetical protein C448_04474 [Halococcus morrhuae DSM 1307]
MGKVNIALRGWRFDESAVFTDDGDIKPIDEMEPTTRERIVRLRQLIDSPCHACWLIHGDSELDACNDAAAVYGEPLSEVVLCEEHEPDFRYWFREQGGADHRGEPALQDAFHEWFADGGRAPEEYEPVEHVDTDPTAVPSVSGTGSAADAEQEAQSVDLDSLDI